MNDQEWLQRATEFDLGKCFIHKRPVKIVERMQLDGQRMWAVKMQEWVLGRDSEWHWEPLPSSRTDEFVKNIRFITKYEAYNFWRNCQIKNNPLTVG